MIIRNIYLNHWESHGIRKILFLSKMNTLNSLERTLLIIPSSGHTQGDTHVQIRCPTHTSCQ